MNKAFLTWNYQLEKIIERRHFIAVYKASKGLEKMYTDALCGTIELQEETETDYMQEK